MSLRRFVLALAVASLPAAALAADKDAAKPALDLPKFDGSALPSLPTGNDAAAAATGEAPQPPPKARPKKAELDVAKLPFDAESIRLVVKHHMDEIQECYEKVIADTGAKLQGRVVIGFIVDTNGVVSEARMLPKKSTLKDERVIDCVLAMRRWPFPKPTDNRDHPIEYPFDLKIKK